MLHVRALYYPYLDEAISGKQLDFILICPEYYVILRQVAGLTAIAILMPLWKGGYQVNQVV